VTVEVTAKTIRISPQPPTTLAMVISVLRFSPLAPRAVSSRAAYPIRIVAPRKTATKLAVTPPVR
jgi:hypothetical protein